MTTHRMTTTAPRLGLGLVHLTQNLAERLSIRAEAASVLVAEVAPGSFAEAANLHAGDVLLAIDDQEVSGALEAREQLLRARQRGATMVELLVRHACELRRLPLRLQPSA